MEKYRIRKDTRVNGVNYYTFERHEKFLWWWYWQPINIYSIGSNGYVSNYLYKESIYEGYFDHSDSVALSVLADLNRAPDGYAFCTDYYEGECSGLGWYNVKHSSVIFKTLDEVVAYWEKEEMESIKRNTIAKTEYMY